MLQKYMETGSVVNKAIILTTLYVFKNAFSPYHHLKVQVRQHQITNKGTLHQRKNGLKLMSCS